MTPTLQPRAKCALVVVALVFVAAGCTRRKRIMQCNRFIDKVNVSLKEINTYTNTPVDDPRFATRMRTLATRFDQLAKAIDAMHITAPELAPHTRRYREMCEHSAAAARHLADAVSHDNGKEVKSADEQFKRIAKNESDLIRQINDACSR